MQVARTILSHGLSYWIGTLRLQRAAIQIFVKQKTGARLERALPLSPYFTAQLSCIHMTVLAPAAFTTAAARATAGTAATLAAAGFTTTTAGTTTTLAPARLATATTLFPATAAGAS